jgi:hypothetical protein
MKDPKLNLGAILYLAEMVQDLGAKDVLVVRKFTVKRVGTKKIVLQGRKSTREIPRGGETFSQLSLDPKEATFFLRCKLAEAIDSARSRLMDRVELMATFDIQRETWNPDKDVK